MKKRIHLCALSILAAGCTSTHLQSISDLPTDRHRPVKAESENWVVFWNGLNNKADEQVVAQLGKECPESAVKVAMVEKTFSIWLLDLLYKQKVTAHGYCTK